MRVLLVGNIANNSYLLAKFLRRRGIEADLLIYDYKHIMGQPEWEDGVFSERVDEFDPDLSKVQNFTLPDWVQRISLHEYKQTQSNVDVFPRVRRVHYLVSMSLYYGLARPLRVATTKWYNKLLAIVNNTTTRIERVLFYFKYKNEFKLISEKYKTYFPNAETDLSMNDIVTYYDYPNILKNIWKDYDLLHLADVNPIYGFIYNQLPYVAFEHGTMRDLPFEPTPRGRLLSMAYKEAKKNIITNCDCIHSAKKLELDNYVFIPHPVDDEKFVPKKTPVREKFLKEFDVDFIIFFPARQSYSIKGTDRAIEAFGRFLKKYPRSLMVLPKWGEDTGKIQNLIEELGIGDNIYKMDPLTRLELVDYYNMADVVFDQFILGAFGTTTPEAMACGKPLFLYLNKADHEWAFPEMPPVVNVQTADEIYNELIRCKEEDGYIERIGDESVKWIKKYHGWESVTDRLVKVYEEALGEK
jgi:glycosyltransferase involved in cell wall biosynthesis